MARSSLPYIFRPEQNRNMGFFLERGGGNGKSALGVCVFLLPVLGWFLSNQCQRGI